MSTWQFEIIKPTEKLPFYIHEYFDAATYSAAMTAAKAAAAGVTGYIDGQDKIVLYLVPGQQLVPGTIADDAVTAGSAGTISAKLRYVTSALGTILTNFSSLLTNSGSLLTNSSSLLTNSASLLTNFTTLLTNFATLLANLPAALTIAGNLKVSVEETKTGTDSVTIQGTAANGATASGNPLQIGGKDGSGNARSLAAATSGALLIEVNLPAIATPANLDTTADEQAVYATPGLRFCGWSVKENASGAALVIIRHGVSDTDPILKVIKLAADSADFNYFDPGIGAENGIFVERASGDTEVTIFNKNIV